MWTWPSWRRTSLDYTPDARGAGGADATTTTLPDESIVTRPSFFAATSDGSAVHGWAMNFGAGLGERVADGVPATVALGARATRSVGDAAAVSKGLAVVSGVGPPPAISDADADGPTDVGSAPEHAAACHAKTMHRTTQAPAAILVPGCERIGLIDRAPGRPQRARSG